MKEKTTFTIAYDGSAIVNGTMDVRDLAPALLAVGELFDAANTVLHGENSEKIAVNVVATQAACFEVDLIAQFSNLKAIKDFLVGENATAIANLLALIGGVSSAGATLFWLIKKLKGGNPDKVEAVGADQVQLTFEDETFVVPLELLRLYREVAVRDAIQKLVQEPLAKEGIDSFKLLDAQRVQKEEVTKSEASYFVSPEAASQTLLKQDIRSAFSIVSLAFKEENKWRLHDGSNPISALITDEDFLRRVNQNQIRFAKGDILVCDVEVEQLQTISGLKTNYTVKKVVEHKPALRQLEIPLPSESGED